MFVCAVTKKPSRPGEKEIKVVTKTRQQEYVGGTTPGSSRSTDGYHEFRDSAEAGAQYCEICPQDGPCPEATSTGWEIDTEISVTLQGLGVLVRKDPENKELAMRYNRLMKAEISRNRRDNREEA